MAHIPISNVRIPNSHWPLLAGALRRPEATLGLKEEDFITLLEDLSRQGVFSSFARAMRLGGHADKLSPACREAFQRLDLLHKAGAAAVWETFDEVIALLLRTGLRPMPIKGIHMGLRFYAEPTLRPMSDVDLLFTDPTDGTRAHGLLLESGYIPKEVNRGGDPWLWSRHLPEVECPRTKVRVEIHGGLLYAPLDRRHVHERALLENPDSVEYAGASLPLLAPESAAVLALAHMFQRHAAEEPRLVALVDVEAILEREGGRFDWDRLVTLAKESGFAGPVLLGLRGAAEVLNLPVPSEAIRALAASAPAPGWGNPRGQTVHSREEWAALRHSIRPVARAFRMLVPSRDFMRWRYPDKARWSSLLLYPYRWAIQFRKAIAFRNL